MCAHVTVCFKIRGTDEWNGEAREIMWVFLKSERIVHDFKKMGWDHRGKVLEKNGLRAEASSLIRWGRDVILTRMGN